MRHNKKFNHLGRTSQHRKLMLSNMACSLIMHKRIRTTLPKAKALRVYVEPILTRSKEDTQHSRRMSFAVLRNKYAVTELFTTVGPRIGDRLGGYTRIVRTDVRQGDNAEMCIIELVDFNDTYSQNRGVSGGGRRRTRRTRRGGGVQTVTEASVTAASGSVAESATEEAVVEASEVTEAAVEETLSAQSSEADSDSPELGGDSSTEGTSEEAGK